MTELKLFTYKFNKLWLPTKLKSTAIASSEKINTMTFR